MFWTKSNDDPEQWKIFASMSSGGLLSRGYDGAKDYLDRCFSALRARIEAAAPNRIDYAFDIKTQAFKLDLDCIVAHLRAAITSVNGWATLEDLSEL